MKDGRHDAEFTGVAKSTNDKLYYVKNGMWDISFSGEATDAEGVSYKVSDGKVL